MFCRATQISMYVIQALQHATSSSCPRVRAQISWPRGLLIRVGQLQFQHFLLQPPSFAGTARWHCQVALPGGTARWYCQVALPGGTARWNCWVCCVVFRMAAFTDRKLAPDCILSSAGPHVKQQGTVFKQWESQMLSSGGPQVDHSSQDNKTGMARGKHSIEHARTPGITARARLIA